MEISVRQVCFILLFYTVASKVLQYPTLLSSYSGNDLLWSSLLSFAVEGAAVWALAYLSSKTDKTLERLLQDTFGKIATRIIFGLLAAYFALVTILPLFEQQQYVHAIFYDTVPQVFVFLPVFFFTVYAGSKSFREIGRCADVALPIFVLCAVPLVFMGLAEVDYTNLMPVLGSPIKDIVAGAGKTSYFFTEPLWLMLFLGRFKYKKGDAAKITLSYAGGALMVMLFLTLFRGIYGELSPSRQFAISKTSLYFSAMEMVGRIDLFVLYAFDVVMLFALVLNIQLAVHCVCVCTGVNCPELFSLGVNAALAAVLYIFNHSYMSIESVFSDWLWIGVLLFTVAAPLGCWALKRGKYEKDRA